MYEWNDQFELGVSSLVKKLDAIEEQVEHLQERVEAQQEWITAHGEQHVEDWPDKTPAKNLPPAPTNAREESAATQDTGESNHSSLIAHRSSLGLEEAKAAARQAVEEPEPPPLAQGEAHGDRPRSPVEMVEAILSNLTLCIDGESIDEVVRHAKQAQRWALILKRALSEQAGNGKRR